MRFQNFHHKTSRNKQQFCQSGRVLSRLTKIYIFSATTKKHIEKEITHTPLFTAVVKDNKISLNKLKQEVRH